MAENRTQATGASVDEFLAAVEHPIRHGDGLRLLELMSGITGEKAEMWGPTIVGFGRYEAVLAELIRAGYRHATTVLHSP